VNVYFFEHPLEAYQMPGRYAYQASAKAIDLDAGMLRPWTGTIYADGFGADTPGSNIDPNVFSEVLPWHLSFCRLTDSKASSIVADGQRPAVLSELVQQGDLIIFGNTFNSKITWVDTIMCVYGRVVIPSKGGHFLLEDEFQRYWDSVFEFEPQMTWERFKGLRDYRCNLIDAMPPNGRHTTTAVVPHNQIIGSRPKFVDKNRAAIAAQLLAGDGFNFIPLRALDAPLLTDSEQEELRPGLLTLMFELKKRFERIENSVHLLPHDLGRRLIVGILDAAKYLVLAPIEPTDAKVR